MRKLLTIICLCGLVGTLAGCANTERSSIFSAGYWGRHFAQFGKSMHQFRVDIDRTIFDLDDRPIEED